MTARTFVFAPTVEIATAYIEAKQMDAATHHPITRATSLRGHHGGRVVIVGSNEKNEHLAALQNEAYWREMTVEDAA